ncbi:MAG TPA: response regulator [Candidatus Angelobacter sp.]|nr:response regulator [Candidatus Angelobacter sp.]
MRTEKPTVLLVEDNDDDYQLMQVAFQRTPGSLELLRAEDGDVALDYLAGKDEYSDRDRYPFPHLVLLDIKLPRRSGFEVLDWIRKNSPLRRLPVVMFTSSRHTVDVNKAYELGASGYFGKPESMKELAILLGELKNVWGRLEFPTEADPIAKTQIRQ